MKPSAMFVYTAKPANNRRATGSSWRGHKLCATIKIRPSATIYKAADHMTYTLTSDDGHGASRAVRADGEPIDNKWYFLRNGEAYYVIDRDVADVDLKTVRIKKEGQSTKGC